MAVTGSVALSTASCATWGTVSRSGSTAESTTGSAASTTELPADSTAAPTIEVSPDSRSGEPPVDASSSEVAFVAAGFVADVSVADSAFGDSFSADSAFAESDSPSSSPERRPSWTPSRGLACRSPFRVGLVVVGSGGLLVLGLLVLCLLVPWLRSSRPRPWRSSFFSSCRPRRPSPRHDPSCRTSRHPPTPPTHRRRRPTSPCPPPRPRGRPPRPPAPCSPAPSDASSAEASRKPHISAASTTAAHRSRARHVPSMPVTPLRHDCHLVGWRIAVDRVRQPHSGAGGRRLLRRQDAAGVRWRSGSRRRARR